MESFLKSKLKVYLKDHLLLYSRSNNNMTNFLKQNILSIKTENSIEHLTTILDNLIRLSYFQKYYNIIIDEDKTQDQLSKEKQELLHYLYNTFTSKNHTAEFYSFLTSYGQSNISLLKTIYEDYYKTLVIGDKITSDRISIEKIFLINNMRKFVLPNEAINHFPHTENITKNNNFINISQTQTKIFNYLNLFGYQAQEEVKFDNYSVDIYLPKQNIAIEFCGPYHFYPYQSQLTEKDKYRHKYITNKFNIEILYIPIFEYRLLLTDIHFESYFKFKIEQPDKLRNEKLFKEMFI